MFSSLDWNLQTQDLEKSNIKIFSVIHLVLPLALSTLQLQHQLLGGLGLLPQDGLGLTSESLLLTIVPVKIFKS